MAAIANVALSNTFDTWRIRHNQITWRMNQFATNESKWYANTIQANNVLKGLGNTVLGVAGKRHVINGRLSANGYIDGVVNVTASGNTSTNKLVVTSSLTGSAANATVNKATVTSRFIVSGNSVVGVAGKRTIINGVITANGRMAIANGNLTVSGNTSQNKSVITASMTGTSANGTLNKLTVTSQFIVPGNTVLGAATKNQIMNGITVANGNFQVTGNTTINTANSFFNYGGSRLTNFAEFANTTMNSSTSKTIPSGPNVIRYTLSATCTITLPSAQPASAPAVKSVVVWLKQNGTGTYVATFAAPSGEAIIWNNSASQPANHTTANKVTIYSFLKFDGDANWYGSQSFIDA